MAVISLKSVQKKYENGFEAVKDFNLEIADREFIILVGPSGCGKSTTMRMIAGLEDISSGTVKIGDRVVNDLPPRERDIAMVFQDYALYPHLSVRENMSLSLKLKKLPSEQIEKKVNDAAKVLDIEAILDNLPKQLSGGQRQRVALGRAIVRTPQVFLFDEPLSNLDPKLRTTMRVELKKLHQNLNATMIYVTHDQVEAMTLGDRIIVMNHGEIQQVGRPVEVYNEPVNMFTASFIGSPPMNFFEAQVELHSEGAWLKGKAIQFNVKNNHHLYEKLASNFAGKPELIVGIRAEDMKIADSEIGEGESLIEAKLDVLEPVAPEVFLHLTSSSGRHFIVRDDSVFNTTIKPGESVRIAVDLSKIHIFEKESGRTVR